MTISVANVNQAAHTFGGWIEKTNQIADALSTKVVTTDSNTTVGNAAITNAFGANQIYANTLYGGNLTSTSALALGSNVYIKPYVGGANVVTVVGNSSTGSFATTIEGNNLTVSTGNTAFNGSRINIDVTNVDIVAATTKLTSNTTLYGNSSVAVVRITGNTSTSNLDVVADTIKVAGVANVVGNTTIQANSTLNNIKVAGNGTISNVTITANDVYLTPSSNVNITSQLYVSNVVETGNVTTVGYVNATASVNSAILAVGTSFVANTTGAYHTGTVNAASFTTTGVRANTTGVFPTSNASGQSLGNTTSRFVISANTINASGLITGSSGATITGTANVSSVLNVGANNTLNTTAHFISSNSTVNTVITATSITQSNTTDVPLVANDSGIYHTGTVNAASFVTAGVRANTSGIYPTSNTVGQTLGSPTQRFEVDANTVDASGLITGASGASITGQTNTTSLLVGGIIRANTTGIFPASNTSGQVLGNTTARVAITASTIAASGAAAISNTLAAGNTTITGFANISGTANVGGDVTLNSNLILTTATSIVANGTGGTTGQVLAANSEGKPYWTNPSSLNVVNTEAEYVFTNTVTVDRSGGTGDNFFTIKSQNTAAITIYGDSSGTGNGTTSGSYLRLGADGISNVALLSIIQQAGINGIGNAYAGTLGNSVLLGTIGTYDLQLGTQNSVVQTITTGGNTGFGNTTPAHKVRVEGTFSALTSVQVGTAFTANLAGVFHTGSVNAAAATFGTTVVANSTGLYSAASIRTDATTSNSSGFFPASNTSGSALGNTLARWTITASSIAASGNVVAAGFQYSNGAQVGIIVYNAAGTQVFP